MIAGCLDLKANTSAEGLYLSTFGQFLLTSTPYLPSTPPCLSLFVPGPRAKRTSSTPGIAITLQPQTGLEGTMSYPTLPPVTPQKPLPGAFFQTPVPSNAFDPPQRSIPRPTAQPNPTPQALPRFPPSLKPAPAQNVKTEERAARTVNDTLTQETRYPDLDSYLSRKWARNSMCFCGFG